MKRLLAALLILSLAVPAFASAVEGEDVKYIGGTIANMKEGTVGRLDTAANNAFVFEYGDGRVEIPYASIQRFHKRNRWRVVWASRQPSPSGSSSAASDATLWRCIFATPPA